MEFLDSTNRRILDPDAIGLVGDRQFARNGTFKASEMPSEGVWADEANDTSLRESFARSLLAGDEQQCRRAISGWYTIHGGMASVSDDLLAPTFHKLGQMWACGEIEVYQERRGCEICIQLVHELRRLVPEPMSTAPLAMGGTAEGDNYQVANQLIEIIFREAGWRTVSLGSGVPFSSLLAAAKKHMPKVFWLSVSYIEDENTFLERFQSFARELPEGIMLVVGGRAMNEALRRRMQYSAHCDSMHQLSTLARNLQPSLSPRIDMDDPTVGHIRTGA